MIEKGNKIKVHYKGTLEDGSEFDNSYTRGEPLEFEVGAGQLIKGFDEAVVGMKEGEKKSITLKSDQAYGEVRDELVHKIPTKQLPQEAKEGMTVGVSLPNGQQVPAKVVEKGEEESVLDLNHPLAGKTLNFEIEVVSE